MRAVPECGVGWGASRAGLMFRGTLADEIPGRQCVRTCGVPVPNSE